MAAGNYKNMNKEQIELSERLRKACLEKGITEPRFVAQDGDGRWFHFPTEPWNSLIDDHWDSHDEIDEMKLIYCDCPKYNWRDTLMEFNPNAGVPLADVLKRTCEHCGKEL